MKLRARPGAVGGPADTLDVSSRTASACGWLHGDTLVVLPSSVPQPRTPPSAAGPAPAAAQAACKPCVLRVVFDSDDDTSDNDSTSSSPFVGIPRWLFNWWTRGDVLGWAAADPSSTDLQVECKVLRSSATPGVAREPATADQPDPPAAVQSSSAGQSSSVVCLARISTTPWTPTSHGIRSSTSDLAAASKAVDPRDDALVKSAQDWSANVRSHLAGRLICTDTLVMLPRNSRPAVFLVAGISRSSPSEPSAGPAEASVITQVDFDDSCQLEFLPALALAPTYHHASILTYPLAAYNQHAKELQAILEASLHRRSLHEMLGIAPSRAMYVAGPRGVGKESLIMHAVCSLVKCPLVYVHLSEELQSLRRGGSKTSALTPLYKAIWKARMTAPSVLVVDGLDLLNADMAFADVDRFDIAGHIRKLLLSLASSAVCIVAPVMDPAKLPDSLRPGADVGKLFTRVVQVHIPSSQQRRDLAKACFQRMVSLGAVAADQDHLASLAERLAQQTAGFVVRDLTVLITRAVYAPAPRNSTGASAGHDSMRNKTLTGADGSVDDLAHQLQSVSLQSQSQSAASQLPHLPVRLEWHDLELWLKHIPPSQAASIGFDTTRRSVPWSRLGGYAKIKAKLSQLVSWPHQHPDVFARLGVKPAAGILLYGPTGCGKTMLVHATASEFNMNFVMARSNEIFSKYLGESEANIRALFAAARQLTPCIVFIDELDAIASRREWTEDGSGGVNERVLSTLLNEMDGVQERQGVVVMACTNRPEKLDDALLRPGRLDCHVHVGLPSESERQEILRAYARSGVALDLRDGEFESFARETVGFTGADLEVLLREAGICALRESMDGATAITGTHVRQALAGAVRGPLMSAAARTSAAPAGWWKPQSTTLADLARIEAFARARRAQ